MRYDLGMGYFLVDWGRQEMVIEGKHAQNTGCTLKCHHRTHHIVQYIYMNEISIIICYGWEDDSVVKNACHTRLQTWVWVQQCKSLTHTESIFNLNSPMWRGEVETMESPETHGPGSLVYTTTKRPFLVQGPTPEGILWLSHVWIVTGVATKH